jgi:alpha-D-ribose 1-methylphosphonate 5-triphosphate synthase subunit PhnH
MNLDSAVATLADPFQTSAGPQGVFRVVLDAMARPGTVRQLAALDEHAPISAARGLAAIAQTLLDHEVSFAVVPGNDGPGLDATTAFVAYVRSVTGCREVPASDADYVLALGALPDGLAAQLKRGQPAYPDEGATLVSLVPSLDGASGITVNLSGPGVPAGTIATIPGWSADDLVCLAEANAAAPLGVDVILVDAGGQVMCLPRSTRISAGDVGRTQEVANGLHRG